MRHRLILLMLVGLAPFWSQANGLRLRQEGGEEGTLRVWVGWQNGWHDSLNHDAVWLFAKAADGEPGGRHLRPQAVSLRQGADRFQVRISGDGLGVWVYPGEGRSFAADSALVELRYAESSEVALRGIEMVFIPAGAFWVGDSLSNKTLGSRSGGPYRLRSDGGLLLNAGNGLFAPPLLGDSGQAPAAFPLGFSAFFCQKYEISQGAWADFISSLNADAREGFYPDISTGSLPNELGYKRSGLRIRQGILEASSGSFRAMGGLRWSDLLAYLDWAGLRPMTETEFEKACRGPELPIGKGYAWGTTLAQTPDSLSGDGSPSERPARTMLAGAGWANFARPVGQPYPGGPVRQGFAATAQADRVSGGFGYWGCAELSGNVWEMCVRLQAGSAFDSTAGDGRLSVDGQADQPGWAAAAPIVRGGAHTSLLFNDLSYPFRDLAVSDRFYQEYDCTQRRSTTGGRGVRSW